MPQAVQAVSRVENPSSRREWEEINIQGNQLYNLAPAQFDTGPIRLIDLNVTIQQTNADIGTAQQAAVQEATQRMEDRINGLDRSKPPVTAVSVTNVPLDSPPGTQIDGIATAVNDIYGYLLIGQTNPVENGIYTQTANGLVRRTDSNDPGEFPQNTAVSVRQGNTLANHTFVMTNDANPSLGADPLYWIDTTPTAIRDGAGLYYTPATNSMSVGTDGTILVTADAIGVDPSYTRARQDELRATENALQAQITVISTAEQQDRADINGLSSRLNSDEITIRDNTNKIAVLDTRVGTEEARTGTLYSNEQSIFAWAAKLFMQTNLAGGGSVSGATGVTITRRDTLGASEFDVPFPDRWGNITDVGGLWARAVNDGSSVTGNIPGNVVTVNGRSMLRVRFNPAVADNTVRLTVLNPVDPPAILTANF